MLMKKTCIIKTLHLMMQMKNMYYKKHCLYIKKAHECNEKNSIIKNIALDDVDEKKHVL